MTLRHLISRLALLSILVIGTSALAFAQEEPELLPFEFRTDPILQVASYYNAINVGEFDRAYSYWETPPDDATLAEFTAGFDDTARIAAFLAAPVTEDPGAGNVFAAVPVLVVAEHTDGSRHNFSGCITVHKVNVPEGDATEPDPNWRLRDADVTEVADFDLTLLETSCEPLFDEAIFTYENQNSPVGVLASYFNAITSHDYARAYGYWENPPTPTLEEFAAGFAETASASLVIRADAFVEGAAGSIYASLPALVTATTTSGDKQFFGGCYATRHSNVPVGDATEPSPEWWIFGADVQELDPVAALNDGIALIDGVCMNDAVG